MIITRSGAAMAELLGPVREVIFAAKLLTLTLTIPRLSTTATGRVLETDAEQAKPCRRS